jgi:uncharacterized protein YfeS
MMIMSDYDPFNEPETAHPRARDLMVEGFFWDCVDEEAPFGSDEGHDALYEYLSWRADEPAGSLCSCLAWIMDDRLAEYTTDLCSDERIDRDLKCPSEAFLGSSYDIFTLDATVIATALGQLLNEGQIDTEAKPHVNVAIQRQLHPKLLTSDHRKEILLAIRRVVSVA